MGFDAMTSLPDVTWRHRYPVPFAGVEPTPPTTAFPAREMPACDEHDDIAQCQHGYGRWYLGCPVLQKQSFPVKYPVFFSNLNLSSAF